VFVTGESGIDMFVIETGLIEVVSADGTMLLAKLRAGDYLGESCLLGTTTTTRTASAYSCGYTHTYVLRNQDFKKVSTICNAPGMSVTCNLYRQSSRFLKKAL
jgi:signal-transduction protein with cAMP-binding, CBS, and nucleotidyltransferase domain